ncbi:MAG: tetratricopeptide repeat protein [Bacteroidota bacterium]
MVEQFLSGKLSEEAHKAFDQQCREDPAFAEEVRTQIGIHLGIRRASTQSLKSHLKEDFLSYPPNVRSHPARQRILLSVAAVIALLLVIAGIHQLFFSTPSSEQLFASYFELPPGEGVRDAASDTEQVWLTAMDHYYQEDYAASIPLLSQLSTEAPFEARAYFYLGICYLMLEQYPQAQQALQSVPSESVFQPDVEWYESLTYLREGNHIVAKEMLQTISQSDRHIHQQNAKQLLEALE